MPCIWALENMLAYCTLFLLGSFSLSAVHAVPNCAHYSFNIGKIKATIVSDGLEASNFTSLVPEVSPVALKLALDENFMPNDARFHYNPMHLDMGDRKVMVDVGSGDTFGPNLGKLLDNMAVAGLDPNAVTDVLITHAHLDHLGGLLKPDGSLAFPNAKVHISRVEYEFWKSAEIEDLLMSFDLSISELLLNVARSALDAVSDKIETFELEAEVIPGITSRGAAGHSPGMSNFIIRDGEHSLMQTGDTFIVEVLSIQHPDWRYLFDGDKEAGIATRLSFLKELADSGMMILAYHNDFPGLGRIYRQSTGYGLRSTRYQI